MIERFVGAGDPGLPSPDEVADLYFSASREPPHAEGRETARLFAGAHAASRPVWLQTTDVDSPARRLYASRGFAPTGHGPDAPDGRPGLVLLRPATG